MQHRTRQRALVAALLARLDGEWEGPEHLEASPWSPGGVATGRHVFTAAAGGTAIAQRYVQRGEGGGPGLEGHGVWTVDPESEEVLWYWFDSIGFPPAGPSRGRWEPGADRLVLEKTSPRGVQRAEFAFDDRRWRHTVSVRLADAPTNQFSLVVTADYLAIRSISTINSARNRPL